MRRPSNALTPNAYLVLHTQSHEDSIRALIDVLNGQNGKLAESLEAHKEMNEKHVAESELTVKKLKRLSMLTNRLESWKKEADRYHAVILDRFETLVWFPLLHLQAHTHTCTHTHTHNNIITHVQIYIYIHRHAYEHTRTHTYIYVQHTYTCNTQAHAHAHTSLTIPHHSMTLSARMPGIHFNPFSALPPSSFSARRCRRYPREPPLSTSGRSFISSRGISATHGSPRMNFPPNLLHPRVPAKGV
jgi:hypothetical protein